ncbi:MAG: hypothetical protein EON54_27905 [Alcaligenaceae bacterium]|nr:MAG: hypothetical protein EON54_27905 [Alcaligenaceae bacterium]
MPAPNINPGAPRSQNFSSVTMDRDELVRDSSFGEEWNFHYYVFPPQGTDGHGGYAEVHRKGEFCCKLLLAKPHNSRAALLAKLREKCVAWVGDWQTRNGD